MAQQLTKCMLILMIEAPGDYYTEVILEFYVSYPVAQDAQGHKQNADRFPCLQSVRGYGVDVKITLEAINALYWDGPIKPTDVYTQKITSKSD